MIKVNPDELVAVLAVQSKSKQNTRMMDFLTRRLTEMGIEYYFRKGNLYCRKGDAKVYPCVVAHTDTVHSIVPNFAIIQNGNYLMAFNNHKQTGIGGDDKVGIYIALTLLANLSACKAAFFIDEEIGCVGSGRNHGKFFDDVGYVLQADRRGDKDITETISYVEMNSDAFRAKIEPLVEKYDRKYVDGAMTDVQALSRQYNISMMNISCGYYRPHSDDEYVVISDVEATLNFMYDVIKTCGNRMMPCDHKDFTPERKKKEVGQISNANVGAVNIRPYSKGRIEMLKYCRDNGIKDVPDNPYWKTFFDFTTGLWEDLIPPSSHIYWNRIMEEFHTPLDINVPPDLVNPYNYRYYLRQYDMWMQTEPFPHQVYYDRDEKKWYVPTDDRAAQMRAEFLKEAHIRIEERRKKREAEEREEKKSKLLNSSEEMCPKCGASPHRGFSEVSLEHFCIPCGFYFSELKLRMENEKNNLN